jgi:hypothetical protein
VALTVTPFEVASWSTTTTPKTTTDTGALNGDKIAALYGGDNGTIALGEVTAATVSTTGGSTSAWTEPQEGLGTTNQAWTSSAVADVTADGTVTMSMARTQSTGLLWGGWSAVCSGHGGLGNTARSAPSSAETVSLTVSQGSAVLVIAIDWDAGTPVAFSPSGAVEVERSQQGGGPDLTFYAGYWLNQAAGTRGYGIATSPTTNLHIIAIEILAGSAAEAIFPHRSLRGGGNRRRFRQYQPKLRRGFEVETAAVAGTNALAECATATGTANDATIQIATGPTAATATGTANNPNSSVKASAGVATGTGTADNTTSRVSPTPATASATGAAQAPSPAIKVNPTSADGTGTAFNATISTGSATNAPAGLASGTGTANNPSASIAPTPTTAAATGTAQNTTSKVSPTPATATGTGVANNATVVTGAITNAAAGLASGTGTANNTTSKVSPTPATAVAAGVVSAVSLSIRASAEAATALGVANTPTVTTVVFVPPTFGTAQAGTMVTPTAVPGASLVPVANTAVGTVPITLAAAGTAPTGNAATSTSPTATGG